MQVKIHKALIRANGARQVFASLRNNLFRTEEWVFVQEPGEAEWHARRREGGAEAHPLGEQQMRHFHRMLGRIRFEDYRDNGWF